MNNFCNMNCTYFDIIKFKYHLLVEQLERLKGITGFISIIGEDKRANVFNRYEHVVRVNQLLNWHIADLQDVDKSTCVFLALFHDINRLPFAHNLEKPIQYSQGEHLSYYMSLFNVKIENKYYDDFNAFYQKDVNFSIESRIVYLLDSIEGFIEDFLFAFSTLGVNIKEIAIDVLSAMGFENIKLLEINTNKLNWLYLNDIAHFTNVFNDITFNYATNFINKNKKDDFNNYLLNYKSTIRKQLEEKVFPINNELVSKGKMVAEKIGIPYMNYLRNELTNPFKTLFLQTDNDLLEAAMSAGIINRKDVSKYYPNLIFPLLSSKR